MISIILGIAFIVGALWAVCESEQMIQEDIDKRRGRNSNDYLHHEYEDTSTRREVTK